MGLGVCVKGQGCRAAQAEALPHATRAKDAGVGAVGSDGEAVETFLTTGTERLLRCIAVHCDALLAALPV